MIRVSSTHSFLVLVASDGLTVAHKLIEDVMMLLLLERTSHRQLGKDLLILALLGSKHPQRLVNIICGIRRQRNTTRGRIHKLLLLLLGLLKLG